MLRSVIHGRDEGLETDKKSVETAKLEFATRLGNNTGFLTA